MVFGQSGMGEDGFEQKVTEKTSELGSGDSGVESNWL